MTNEKKNLVINWLATPTEETLLHHVQDPSYRYRGDIPWSECTNLIREWDWNKNRNRCESITYSHFTLSGHWDHEPSPGEVLDELQRTAQTWHESELIRHRVETDAVQRILSIGPDKIEIRVSVYSKPTYLWPTYSDLGLPNEWGYTSITQLMKQARRDQRNQTFFSALSARANQLIEDLRRRNQQQEEDRKRRQAEKEAQEKADQEARSVLLVKILGDNHSEQIRYLAGYMAETEQREIIRKHLWPAGADDLAKYRRLKTSDLPCTCCEEYSATADFESGTHTGPLSREQFAALTTIKNVFGIPDSGFELQIVDHIAECSSCSRGIHRLSCKAIQTIHGWTLNTHYALDLED